MDIYVINLAHSLERRAEIERQWAALSLEGVFFKAIDFQAGEHLAFTQYSEIACQRAWRKPLTSAEIACFASHYRLWELCVRQDRPMVILEDDACLSPRFPHALGVLDSALAHYPYIRLEDVYGRATRWIQTCEGADSLALVHLPVGAYGTAAYALSPHAARVFLHHASQWTMAVDHYINQTWVHHIPLIALSPAVVRQGDHPSTISHRKSSGSALRKIQRLCRKALDHWQRWQYLHFSLHIPQDLGRDGVPGGSKR